MTNIILSFAMYHQDRMYGNGKQDKRCRIEGYPTTQERV